MTLVSRLSTLLIVLLLAGCSQEKVQVIEGSIYGTTYSVQFTENVDKEEIHKLIKTELNRIDMVFSTYKPSSDISLVNDCRRAFDPNVKYDWDCERELGSPELSQLILLSDRFFFKTDGAFYIRDESNRYSNGLQPMDLSAIGKGYAVDKIAELLVSNGVFNYFIDIGGELSINGTKFGELWTWGINNPINPDLGAYRAFKAPQDGISIATSGEYRNPGHIWGSSTASKAGASRDALSVTIVISKTSYNKWFSDIPAIANNNTANADAWATAMYVLGVEKGLEIAEKEGLAVFFIKNDGKSINSSEWSKIYP